MASHYCEKCRHTMKEEEFYRSKRIDKYPPNGIMNICKKCLTMHIDNWDPETYKYILKEVDVPYVKKEWDNLLERYKNDPKKLTGTTILGRYLSKMKLNQWRKYTWDDTEEIEKECQEEIINSMTAQGYSNEEIEQRLAADMTPSKPKELETPQEPVEIPQESVEIPQWTGLEQKEEEEEEDEFDSQLTEEDKTYLRLKWGRGYRAEEWVRMEQLYNDMMNSYDIQTAGHKDTLIMICKASLKVNQLMDAGDLDAAQKVAKMYDSLMRSGKFNVDYEKLYQLPLGFALAS